MVNEISPENIAKTYNFDVSILDRYPEELPSQISQGIGGNQDANQGANIGEKNHTELVWNTFPAMHEFLEVVITWFLIKQCIMSCW